MKPSNPKLIGIITKNEWQKVNGKWILNKETNKSLQYCSIIEFRGDTFDNDTVIDALKWFAIEIKDRDIKLLYTIRLPQDGGLWKGSAESRNDFFERAMPFVDYIDIEIENIKYHTLTIKKCHYHTTQWICSHHHFEGTYSKELYLEKMTEMKKKSPSMIKIVVSCNHREDLITLLETAGSHSLESVCLMSMGEWGKFSRYLSPLLGASYTYGFLGKSPTVLGQVPISDLNHFFSLYQKDTKKIEEWLEVVQHYNPS